MVPSPSIVPLQIAEPEKTDSETATAHQRKGRSFTAACLGWVTAPLLGVGSGLVKAPAFLVLAGPITTLKPFVANLLHGDEKAVVKSGTATLHALRRDKSVTLRHRWQRDGRQSLLMAWHPAFELEPDILLQGSDPVIRFVTMPRRDWIEQQSRAFAGAKNPLLSARAAHFCAFLSRRTRLPIANDPGFHLHLFDTALEEPWAVQGTETSRAIRRIGLDAYHEPILCSVKPEEFESWLRDRTREFFGSASQTTTLRKAA